MLVYFMDQMKDPPSSKSFVQHSEHICLLTRFLTNGYPNSFLFIFLYLPFLLVLIGKAIFVM